MNVPKSNLRVEREYLFLNLIQHDSKKNNSKKNNDSQNNQPQLCKDGCHNLFFTSNDKIMLIRFNCLDGYRRNDIVTIGSDVICCLVGHVFTYGLQLSKVCIILHDLSTGYVIV